jgi:predicted transcriptional regulator
MSIPCEVAVKSVIPALRAYIAKELTQSYGLKQTDIAKLLGITQTAVSKYATHVRGAVLQVENIDEIQVIVKEMCISLKKGNMARNELIKHFCAACKVVRQKRLMCKLCKRSDPTIEIHHCLICVNSPACGF